jgi:hypothetical protein
MANKKSVDTLKIFFALFLAQIAASVAFGLGSRSFASSMGGNSLYVGVGYFSENAYYKIQENSTAQTQFLGTADYPLVGLYHYELGDGYFLEPQIGYNFLGRSAAGNSATATILNFMVPYGTTFSVFGLTGFDWTLGPGLLRRTLVGSGGTVTLNNGTGTTTFAMPSSSNSSTTLTLNAGLAYVFSGNRFAFDIISEGYLSKKLNFNLMASYSYAIY